MKPFIFLLLLGVLSACSGLETKSLQVEIGSSKTEVLSIMGTSPYPESKDGVIAWRYASKASLGYCDYREIFIFRDKVIHTNSTITHPLLVALQACNKLIGGRY